MEKCANKKCANTVWCTVVKYILGFLVSPRNPRTTCLESYIYVKQNLHDYPVSPLAVTLIAAIVLFNMYVLSLEHRYFMLDVYKYHTTITVSCGFP